jgi:WD40 repeat protein/Flp pilus assembly protein TadD
MPWPLSQDYNEAIQSPAVCFSDLELRRCQTAVNALGLPQPCSGSFADVYELRSPGGPRWAVKCFTRQTVGLRDRYAALSASLGQARLSFAMDFDYLQEGIRVQGAWYPVVKMHWVAGLTLNEFVRENADKPTLLEALGHLWVKMARRLRKAGIAHGDLQHGNVLLVPGSSPQALTLKLIDYDGMYVPALAGMKSGEVGHPNYQHPQRLREGTYGPEVDRFGLLVVAAALRCLQVGGRPLWERYDNGDNLLFKQADFESPHQSPLFAELLKLPDAEARCVAARLMAAAQKPLEQTPLLAEVFPAKPAAPKPVEQPPLPEPVLGRSDQRSSWWTRSQRHSPAAAQPLQATTPARILEEVPTGVRQEPHHSMKPARRRIAARIVAALALLGLFAGLGLLLILARDSQPPPNAGDKREEENARLEKEQRQREFDELLLRGKTAMARRDYRGARDVYREALELFPKDSDAQVGLEQARTCLQAEENAMARDKKEQEKRQTVQHLKEQATDAMNGKRYDEAVRVLSEIRQLDPVDEGAKELLNQAQAALNKHNAEQKHRTELTTHMDAGRKALRDGQYARAIRELGHALDMEPENAEILAALRKARYGQAMLKGQDALKAQHFQDSIAAFNAAIAEMPGDQAATDALRQVLALKGRVLAEPIIKAVEMPGEVWTRLGEVGEVSTIAFSPDGGRLLWAGEKRLILADAVTGKPVRSMDTAERVDSVAFSPDGQEVLSGGADKKMWLWKLETGKTWRSFDSGPVSAVAFGARGGRVLAACRDPGGESCRVWDTDKAGDGSALGNGPTLGSVLAVSPDGQQALFSSDSHSLCLWDIADKSERHSLQGHTARVMVLAFSCDGETAASAAGGKEMAIRLWDLEKGKEIGSIKLAKAAQGLAFCRDGRLASCSEDGAVRLWDPRSQEELCRLEGPAGCACCLAVSPDGRLAVTGGKDGKVRLWRLPPPDLLANADRASGEVRKYAGHTGGVRRVALSSDGSRAFSLALDGSVRLWDVGKGRELARFAGEGQEQVSAAAFWPDGRHALVCTDGKSLRLWNLEVGGEVHRFPEQASGITHLVVSADGRLVLSCSPDKDVLLWDGRQGKVLHRLGGHDGGAAALAFAPDGKRALTGSNQGLILLWDTATGAEVKRLPGHESKKAVRCVAFLPDGRHALSGGDDNILELWDLESGKEVRQWTAHTGGVFGVAVSADGRRALSCGGDKVVRLWDLATGKQVQGLEGSGGEVWDVAFSPDGRYAFWGSADKTLYLWRLSPAPQVFGPGPRTNVPAEKGKPEAKPDAKPGS